MNRGKIVVKENRMNENKVEKVILITSSPGNYSHLKNKVGSLERYHPAS